MTKGFLDVFISSKEKTELVDDRLVVEEIVYSLCLNPINSENRHAVSNSMESENIREVRESHLYIGILGKSHSDAVREEFDTARANRKKVLIFIRDVQKRNYQLKSFIEEIRDPKTGIITRNYTDVIKLREEVKASLMKELSKAFKDCESNDGKNKHDENTAKDALTVIGSVIDFDLLDHNLKNTKFNLSETVTGKVTIDDVKFKKTKQDSYLIETTVRGSVEKGFVDLLIIDENNKHIWIPDYNTWDSVRDLGKMKIDNTSKTTKWNFDYKDLNKIKGLYVMIFEDKEGNNKDKRILVQGKDILGLRKLV
jgi:hypothetical protein